VALAWTQERKCGSCHTNYPYLMTRGAVKAPSPAEREVRKYFEDRAANWDTAKPRWDAEVVATAAALAFHDTHTTGKLHPLSRQALDRMWKLQQADGGWKWIKCDWAPMEHDDYYGAVLAALGAAHAGKEYSESASAKAGVAKLRTYLQKRPAPDLHHRALLLWASQKIDGLMTKEQQKETLDRLLALQKPDGGWSLPSLGTWKRRNGEPNDPKAASDGYGTGLALVVLRASGIPATDERIQRGAAWLRSNQRESGKWFTRSLNNDKFHYIAHAGTAFALLALRECELREGEGKKRAGAAP
jgi:squalene-hopene/tetraprenyl-beta-curcumene cyclase